MLVNSHHSKAWPHRLSEIKKKKKKTDLPGFWARDVIGEVKSSSEQGMRVKSNEGVEM